MRPRAPPPARRQGTAEVAGPAWLTGAFAAGMILTASYSASRLAVSRLRGLATEADTDGLHALMGTAMAGMLVSQLDLLPSSIWLVAFGTGAAWFGASAIRARTLGRFSWQCRFPVPHLIECIAMLYMLLAVPGAQPGAKVAMPGMGASPSAPAGFPALAVVLALFMLGYLLWATDQLAALARAKTRAAAPARTPEQRSLVTVPAVGRPHAVASTSSTPPAVEIRDQDPAAGQALLAPKLAAGSKIAMSIAMGYMLIAML
jgi:Domain of unknown function (DUF5134)